MAESLQFMHYLKHKTLTEEAQASVMRFYAYCILGQLSVKYHKLNVFISSMSCLCLFLRGSLGCPDWMESL